MIYSYADSLMSAHIQVNYYRYKHSTSLDVVVTENQRARHYRPETALTELFLPDNYQGISG